MAELSDLVVVGGGAAGLACALAGARLGLKVLVLERGETCGRKLSITGGRKGNFTHAEPPRKMADRFDCPPALIVPLLRRFPWQRVVKFFESTGIRARTDSEGCVWPAGSDAAGMRDAMLRCIAEAGGIVRTGNRVLHIVVATRDRTDSGDMTQTSDTRDMTELSDNSDRVPSRAVVLDNGQRIPARNLCIATGGASYPHTGSTGDGIRLAAELGLATTPWFVALASLKTREDFSELSGISQPLVGMQLLVGPGMDRLEKTREASGHFIFAHEHVSGSSVLKLCGFAGRSLATGGQAVLRVDWAPNLTAHQLEQAIDEARTKQNRAKLTTVMAAWVSRRLAVRLCRLAGVPEDRYMAALTRKEAEATARVLKAADLEVVGTEPIERATVSGGGVSLDEIELTTMGAKRFPGLYFAGEVIDLWAETGGYNLHFAWASGIAVAEAVAGRELE